MSEVIRGDGWAVAPDLDSMGEGYGFRKLRRELDVTEFGVNVITIPPGYSTGGHFTSASRSSTSSTAERSR